MIRKIFFGILFLMYLLALAYFALRPFHRIPGLSKGTPSTGLEDARGAAVIRESLMKTGRMSLAAFVHSDPANKAYMTLIISLSRDSLSRNFTLGQYRNGLAFRLRTTETDLNGRKPSLILPNVFDGAEPRHVAVTYDGHRVRGFVDGQLRTPELKLSGNFDNWARNHLLTMGDEPPGGAEWDGRVESFSLYDRTLDILEIEALAQGESVSDAIYSYRENGVPRGGMRRLRYRNLFVLTDPIFNPGDCIANIIGFIPLAFFIALICPEKIRKKMTFLLILPVIIGFMISVMIEYVQQIIVSRVPSLLDIGYNVFGALLGSLLLWIVIGLNRHALSLHEGEKRYEDSDCR